VARRLEVYFGATQFPQSEISGRVIAVIDVLRASTSIAVALANGARAVIPFDSSDDAVSRAKALERKEVRLAGEHRMLPIPGFDLGNSPLEFTREAVEGRTILMATTNGTGALSAVQGGRDVVVASYVNFTAVLAMLRAALRGGSDVAIVCAGRERQFSLEDAACAGRFVRHAIKRLGEVQQNDAARASVLIDRKYGDDLVRLFGDATHGQALAAAGFADDLVVCARIDSYGVVPIYHDRQITRLGPHTQR
jgi:2-phosphosulfolactate phosphatase